MRGTLSNDGRVYFYESAFFNQGENGLSISQLRSIFIKNFLNDQRARYVTENYTLEKEQRRISVFRKDGKLLSEDELLKLDVVVPQIFETY
ncbi:hypothetical protein ACFFH2_08405 [Enterococcus devriesei]|uniref:Uncharacterized protein n=1 Tax=Enterococcus devriesei TaxID=319970 RepID=A0A1L8SVY1_9ENTE|nr:hypothetical protein [Enterococcus devriesei]OJG36123.1 hypothetical protein RV00_GL002267 [Enterococcus devriesei]